MQTTLPYSEETEHPIGCHELPDGWALTRLGDLITVQHGFAFSGHKTVMGETCLPVVVTIGNYHYEGGFRFETTAVKRFDKPYPKEYELQPGNILLAMTCQTMDGEILGLPAKVPNDNNVYLHNQRLGKVIVTRPDQVCEEFLYWLFLSSSFNKHLVETASGTKVRHTAPNRIEAYKLCLPPLAEQQRIAAILDDSDTTIHTAKSLIEAKNRYKRALTEQLMTGKPRFPEFSGAWQKRTLNDLTLINIKTLSENTCSDYHFTYIDLSSVDEGEVTIPTAPIEFQNAPSRARRCVTSGDILVATVRPYLQGFAFINWKPQDVVCSTGFAVLTAKEGHDPRYIYEWLFTDDASRQFSECLSGSSFPAVSAKDVASMRLRVPVDSWEEHRIADVLSLLQEEIVLLRQELTALKQQKQGLMQKLLTGQVRVKEVGV